MKTFTKGLEMELEKVSQHNGSRAGHSSDTMDEYLPPSPDDHLNLVRDMVEVLGDVRLFSVLQPQLDSIHRQTKTVHIRDLSSAVNDACYSILEQVVWLEGGHPRNE
jgi:hypothetical protein